MQTVCNTFWDGKGNLTAQNTRKPFGGQGSASDGRTPLRELTALPQTPSWGGAGCPLPRTPSLALGPSGLASSTPTPKLVPTPLNMSCVDGDLPALWLPVCVPANRFPCNSAAFWSFFLRFVIVNIFDFVWSIIAVLIALIFWVFQIEKAEILRLECFPKCIFVAGLCPDPLVSIQCIQTT